MPAQTKIQVRRDTATNWSSVNPVLASGEMGYDTTNNLFKIGDGATAWNSLKVLAQQNTGSAARPLLTDGAYLDGSTGLVLSGLSANYASAPDSAALSVTGDIDIKVRVKMTDWTPSATTTLTAKRVDSGNQQSWTLNVTTGGLLRFITSSTGSGDSSAANSTVATGIADGTEKWVRATRDVNDGAGNNLTKFYTSDDGTTWTQLGTTVTNAGTTSVFDSTAPVEVGSYNLGATNPLNGTVSRVIIQSAYDTTDNTTSVVFDANFATQTADALAFTESSSNAATVTVNTTRYSYGVPGFQGSSVSTQALTQNIDFYNPFVITAASIVDMIGFEVVTGPASNSTVYMAVYAADANFQVTGSPVLTAQQAVNASQTGIFRVQILPVTLQPGNYVTAFNCSITQSIRSFRGGISFIIGSVGASPYGSYWWAGRTAAAFTSTSTVFANIGLSGAAGSSQPVFLRWKAA